jgi:photosystem II stability/assembly factor-like uncharacterized protein
MIKSVFTRLAAVCVCCLSIAASASTSAPTPWIAIGPEGGDARAFAPDPANPSHIYLGTLSGWMYESQDSGAHWTQLSNIDNRSDLVLDNILVDPKNPQTLLVGAWVLGSKDGGLYRSSDAGHTWSSVKDMKGQSIRALTRSDSNPETIVAGTIQGVFQSTDNGDHWSRISPQENAEIHEVESIAIDPKNPKIIYAGTWHLPWKTTDGGKVWSNVKQGLIDDSDVFSIILDPVTPSTVYLSACSGIYKSTDSGAQFTKIQGIPSTARRTRVLMQDPVNRNIVYAGTTEGLYKTSDAGHEWVRMTSPEVIINDIFVDPRDNKHVLLATDRGGVVLSSNAGVSFTDANRGILQRQVSALAIDPSNANNMYVGVLNDKTFGGVFASTDGGSTWSQRSNGLQGRDVFSLAATPDGMVLAGTNHGLLAWQGAGPWQSAGKVVTLVEKKTIVAKKDKKTGKIERTTNVTQVPKPAPDIEAAVGGISIGGKSWYAASMEGVFRSSDKGATWVGGPLLGETGFHYVSAHDDLVFAGTRTRLFVSSTDGANWMPSLLPKELTRVQALLVSPDGVLWVAGPEGVWTSHDNGSSYQRITTLPINDISSVTYDAGIQKVIVTSWKGDLLFGTKDDGATWNYWNAGWQLRSLNSVSGQLYGVSLYHGIVKQPAAAAGDATGQQNNAGH